MENHNFFRASVDGCEILHQLKTVVYPIIYRLSTIRGGAGFRNHPQYVDLPERQKIRQKIHEFLLKCHGKSRVYSLWGVPKTSQHRRIFLVVPMPWWRNSLGSLVWDPLKCAYLSGS